MVIDGVRITLRPSCCGVATVRMLQQLQQCNYCSMVPAIHSISICLTFRKSLTQSRCFWANFRMARMEIGGQGLVRKD
jgi:hypothetical protein